MKAIIKTIVPFLTVSTLCLLCIFTLKHTSHAADKEAEEETPYIEFSEEENLVKGRELWIKNCEGCHAYGIAGSPIPMKPKHWKERVKKDREVLHKHAIEGFFGEDDAMMPERGGNLKLTDDEVKAAVDYMVALAEYYIEKQTD